MGLAVDFREPATSAETAADIGPAHEQPANHSHREERMDNTHDVINEAYTLGTRLGQLAEALSDEELREEVLAVQANWRDLTHEITASALGLVRKKRRQKTTAKLGRPPKNRQDDPARAASADDTERAADNVTSSSTT